VRNLTSLADTQKRPFELVSEAKLQMLKFLNTRSDEIDHIDKAICFNKCISYGELYLNDFRTIRDGGRNYSPKKMIQLHEKSLDWLQQELENPFDGKTVVITHHLPSMSSVAERYKQDLLSACFSSELAHLFGKMSLWIHGHTHDSCDCEMNGTRVVCNPRGYVRSNHAENPEFNPSLIIEI
jgi:hypothetical protein